MPIIKEIEGERVLPFGELLAPCKLFIILSPPLGFSMTGVMRIQGKRISGISFLTD
jgi:hypothetical protein